MSFSPQTQRHLDRAKAANTAGEPADVVAVHVKAAYETGTPEDKAQIKKGYQQAMRTWPKR